MLLSHVSHVPDVPDQLLLNHVTHVPDQPLSREVPSVPDQSLNHVSQVPVQPLGERSILVSVAPEKPSIDVPGRSAAFELSAHAAPWFPEGGGKVNHCVVSKGFEVWSAEGAQVETYAVKKAPTMMDEDLFFKSQDLGTVVVPRCGGCKCSKCPVPGSRFSFKEQTEFDIINKNLFRKDGVWYSEYPWSCPRSVLPRNEKIAFKNLLSLERTLGKNEELANDFCQQIDDMVARGAAVILSEEELADWEGDYHYLPMVGVKGKKKWLRVCFDAARRQGGSPCFNSCLYKGPDCFMNNLLSVITGFRNGRVAAAADISKFHNRIRLIDKDVHMQRFLWRKMKTDEEPQTYAVAVNNFGVKPANCIATCALHQSADVFKEVYPVESEELKIQTYVDDEMVADKDMESLVQKTQRLDEITDHANMPNKGWLFSGQENPHAEENGVSIGGEDGSEKVLGLLWHASVDMFGFRVVLKLKSGSAVIEVSSVDDFDRVVLSLVLTRRLLLCNVHRIFDPVGFLCPLLLVAKLLMRASWSGSVLGWDDPIPEDLAVQWRKFLRQLLKLVDLEFPRSLWPAEETVGQPWLIIFSDGSSLAFGAVAYIRWELKSGGYWSRMI